MEEENVIPASDPEPGNNEIKGMNRLLLPLFIILVLVIGAGAFFIGSQKVRQTSEPSPSPLVSPEASLEPSPTGSPTATPKATKTPTPTPTPAPSPISVVLGATSSLDGFQSSNGGGNSSIEIRAGRNINLVTRGFVSFDISSIPAGKTIDKATLRLYQTSVTGNPYGIGGSLKVDHLDYGASFENSDYSAASLSSSFGTLTSNDSIEWKDLDVTDRLKDDISNGRTRSQYRVHFAIETIGGNVIGDFANFESANNSVGTGNTPQLVIKYY